MQVPPVDKNCISGYRYPYCLGILTGILTALTGIW